MAQLIKGKQIASQSVTLSGTSGNVIVSGDINVGGFQVNVTNFPITNTQLANKAYVDAVAQGVSPHAPVLVVSTSNISTMSGVTTIDSVLLVEGDRVLLSGQVDKTQNGLFNIHSGATGWTRTSDADGDPDNEVELGDFVFVTSGITNGSTGWVLGKTDSPDMPITPGVDTQEWYKMAAPGTYSADNEGITLEGTSFKLVLDGTSLSKSASGLRVSASYTTSIETLVSSTVSSEASLRTNADTSLATSISTTMSTEVSTRTGADSSLSTALSSEISTRTGADSSLATAISSSVLVGSSLDTALSSEISTRTGADTSLDTAISTTMSTEVATRSSADASLASMIDGLNSPSLYSENITPANSGITSNVIVSTSAFVFSTGTVSLNSISVHLNGIQYNFNYTQGTGVVFYTSGTPTAGAPVTLYFDGTQADFIIETTDEINVKFTSVV